MQTKLLIESQYFPPIAFFALAKHFCQVLLNPHERFEKQTYRNRCSILGSNKVLDLVVPVQKGKTQLTSGEVCVVYAENWPIIHLRAIRSAYGRAPYFDHYYPQIEAIIKTQHKTIFDLGKSTIDWACRVLGCEFLVSSFTQGESPITDGEFIDGRSLIHPKKAASGEWRVASHEMRAASGEPQAASHDLRASSLLTSCYSLLASQRYFQCFEHSGFVPNLSIIDLIMNEGPAANQYLKKLPNT